MRTIRRRSWFIKRIALGLAVAAFAAPVAQAQVDEGSSVQASAPHILRGPHDAMPSAGVLNASGYQAFVTDFPSVSSATKVVAADFGMPRATPLDYAIGRGDLIEVVRSTPSGAPSDTIEFVRSAQPRSTSPELFGRFARPNATTSPEVAAVNVDFNDAAIGAGLVLALVLLGGGAAMATRHMGREQTA
jgi:hypothetical protein